MSDDQKWNYKLKQCDEFLTDKKRLPSRSSENEESLANFITKQKNCYAHDRRQFKNEENKEKWKEFIEKHKNIFK